MRNTTLEDIQNNRNDGARLHQLLPIVKCSFFSSKYEELLMTKLRDASSSMRDFRIASEQLAGLLAAKVIELLPTKAIEINTPVAKSTGQQLAADIHLVSIMRSGDALLESFAHHFPTATISKFLIQRDEETALPQFKYMKLSPSLGPNSIAVITEPMIATGGTLEMVILLLKQQGIEEEDIIIASVCTAPEGLLYLAEKFPHISVVMSSMDDHLNEHKYIVPGIGDFGDRYFGTARSRL